ncbi:histidine kinase/DNA gyrase B/HSP90-like ATPase [Saccharothrix australiensis]|uniref:Histidine kinase/DNA gyrase B/HSP90-like ATPase n=2 Tax=Saccharothrix australiensis TaxID=2072 RepID=A0A495VTT1_9PSEU|nr:histidine kinase/DNA gyrase B/HSP90-like ATPase [Saccharothrix australiensis]
MATRVDSGPAVRPRLVDPANFLFATRDTGYKTTGLAIAELIDNSLQAGARHVKVEAATARSADRQIEITVIDDGGGMDAESLAEALTFGGTSRFNDRSSLGRYGMGLPNGALSRSRRVEVYTWRPGTGVLWSRLDIDELVNADAAVLPPVELVERPGFVPDTDSGTVVRLMRCDRVEYKRSSALARRLRDDLGRIYRHFLADGVSLQVNGQPVVANDPLCLQPQSKIAGGTQFGDDLLYEIPVGSTVGTISVTFSELPVDRWHALSAQEKRTMGVTAGPPISVVRASREIDRGWFFMGGKRRENYDDWWRCEIRFDPILDELFGITHAKQAISPRPELWEIISPDLETIARALNSRVRNRFLLVKATEPLSAAEQQAARADASLPSLPRGRRPIPEEIKVLVDGLIRHEAPYQIAAAELPTMSAYEVVVRDRQVVVLLNTKHPWYRDLYGPLAMSESGRDHDLARQVALTVLASARAEATLQRQVERGHAQQLRQTSADVLATFMNA